MPLGSETDADLPEHWRRLDEKGRSNQGAAQLLECLGSIELETLVAKLLGGARLPRASAPGGTLPDIDLFAWNDSRKALDLNGLKIPCRKVIFR